MFNIPDTIRLNPFFRSKINKPKDNSTSAFCVALGTGIATYTLALGYFDTTAFMGLFGATFSSMFAGAIAGKVYSFCEKVSFLVNRTIEISNPADLIEENKSDFKNFYRMIKGLGLREQYPALMAKIRELKKGFFSSAIKIELATDPARTAKDTSLELIMKVKNLLEAHSQDIQTFMQTTALLPQEPERREPIIAKFREGLEKARKEIRLVEEAQNQNGIQTTLSGLANLFRA